MEPEGLYPLLVRVWARFQKPIILTENGVADMHDGIGNGGSRNDHCYGAGY